MNIAALHAALIYPSGHFIRKGIDRASIVFADELDQVELSTVGSLAAESPVRVGRHDGKKLYARIKGDRAGRRNQDGFRWEKAGSRA